MLKKRLFYFRGKNTVRRDSYLLKSPIFIIVFLCLGVFICSLIFTILASYLMTTLPQSHIQHAKKQKSNFEFSYLRKESLK